MSNTTTQHTPNVLFAAIKAVAHAIGPQCETKMMRAVEAATLAERATRPTATTTQHTPTPWALGKSDGKGICTVDAVDPKDGQPFILCEVMGIDQLSEYTPEAAANAAFIVRACNSHDQLVAALAEAIEIIRAIDQADNTCSKRIDVSEFRAALAAAGSAQ